MTPVVPPPIVLRDSPRVAPAPPPQQRRSPLEIRRALAWGALILGATGWLVTAFHEPSFLVFVNYVALGFAAWGFASLVTLKWFATRWRMFRLGRWAAVLCVLVAFGRVDRYDTHWESEGFRFTDSYYRFGEHRPYYRFMAAKSGAPYYQSGSMAGETKPHGKWTMGGSGDYQSTWYWYGEEISEGDWHLRNK